MILLTKVTGLLLCETGNGSGGESIYGGLFKGELTLLVIMIRAPIDQPILRESSASPDLVGDRSQSLTLIAVPRSHGLDSICTSPRSLSDGQLAAI